MKNPDNLNDSRERLTIAAQPERRLIRPGGSRRYVLFLISASQGAGRSPATRTPLDLALVLDRSGSMGGEKFQAARRATLAVLDRLSADDRATIVVFDDQIDVVQPLGEVTTEFREAARRALAQVGPRGSTALHEGWLTGCRAVAAETSDHSQRLLARCFLLTDGQANVGLTDPERLAQQAADIRRNALVGTSTFGFGEDYEEDLLAPMADAGGGQFHHLKTGAHIDDTFKGEIGELLSVAFRHVRLEIDAAPGMRVEFVSAYRANLVDGVHYSAVIGDLAAGAERPVVARVRFPAAEGKPGHALRARICWIDDRGSQESAWQSLQFEYAGHSACDAEPKNSDVLHWAGLHEAERAESEAAQRSRAGDMTGARMAVARFTAFVAPMAKEDADLQTVLDSANALDMRIQSAPLSADELKELRSKTQRRMRGQQDYRKP